MDMVLFVVQNLPTKKTNITGTVPGLTGMPVEHPAKDELTIRY
jgi:hypothetical protein